MKFRIASIWGVLAIMTACLCLTGVASASINETFDSPVTTGATQAAGTWYTDRYAPAGFTSPVSFGGDNRLQHSISAADGANNRSSSFSTAFYNTQGRKYDLDPGTTSMQIDLYIPSAWGTTGRRMAGFWGTGDIPPNGSFPIVEFTSSTDGSGTARFRGWSSATGSWTDMGLPTGFAYDTWQTLLIELVGPNFVYTVGDLTLSVPALGTTSIVNTILQGHNTDTGVSYDIHWDNFIAPAATGVVPEPATILVWSGIAACAGLAYVKKQRKS